jgi:hypothetical protein
MTRRRPNLTFDRTAGSHTLATAGQRARHPYGERPRVGDRVRVADEPRAREGHS